MHAISSDIFFVVHFNVTVIKLKAKKKKIKELFLR
jgi:hypothetical protein